MTYFAIVTEIKELEKHPKLDNLLVARIFGDSVLVSKDTNVGDKVIYFPSDGQLSHDFCYNNNLYRHSNMNKDQNVSGYLEDNRRVRIIKLRQVPSDGLVLPLTSLNYLKVNPNTLVTGTQFCEVNGKLICNKYVTEKTVNAAKGGTVRTAKKWDYPLFKEHKDTEQLKFFVDSIPDLSRIIVTEKLHGTSHRISNTLKSRKENILDKILGLFGYKKQEWTVVNGTRRTVLTNGLTDSYYGDDFRKIVDDKLSPVLFKGETVYCEIVGWINEDKPIMNSHNIEKLKDLEMLKRYGNRIFYTYGCPKGTCDFYVYRITMTNEDGHDVEYSWDQVKARCDQLGVNFVPEIDSFIYDISEKADSKFLMGVAEMCADGESTLDFSHIREGVCFRIENEYGTKIYKHKSIPFKIMEDILKADDVADMEESS